MGAQGGSGSQKKGEVNMRLSVPVEDILTQDIKDLAELRKHVDMDIHNMIDKAEKMKDEPDGLLEKAEREENIGDLKQVWE